MHVCVLTPYSTDRLNHLTVEIIIRTDLRQRGLRSRVAFAPGEVLMSFAAGISRTEPSYRTIQIDAKRHIELVPEFLEYVNHSCDPNMFFDVDRMRVVCVRPTVEGDELTFFYPSTEWRMSRPFECGCGSPRCVRTVNGAHAVPRGQMQQYAMSAYIQKQLGL